jgi:hypothetical protein
MPNNFDGLAGFDFAAEIGAHSRRWSRCLCSRRVVPGELDPLAESITVRPELFRKDFIDDGHARAPDLRLFQLRKRRGRGELAIQPLRSSLRRRCPTPR